jgi:hypothetical protein
VVIVDESPATTTTDADEGRAMLQLVHDIAPKARLGFGTANGGQLQFADNIRSLAGLPGAPRAVAGFKADIIVDDVIYLTEPMFSDGIVAQAVNDVTAAGKHYFSAAGNNPSYLGYGGNFNRVASSPAAAAIAGSNINLTGVDPALYAGGFHNFRTDGTQDIAQTLRNIDATGPSNTQLVLQWDDPFDKLTQGTQTFTVSANFTGTPAALNYLIPLAAGVPTRIALTAAVGSAFDAVLTITDPSGAVLINAQDTVIDETVFFTPTQSGNYKITVEAFGNTTGNFTLSAFANSSQGVTTEYNVLFFRADGAFIAARPSSALLRNQPVVSSSTIPIPAGQSTVQMVIARSAGSVAKRLRYVLFEGSTTVRPDEYISYLYPMIYGHSAAANSHAVAAFSAFRPYIPEGFTSPGPVTILFDANGNRLATPEVRQQPAISAMDGANTTFFIGDNPSDADAFPNFFGTSAAAPNAAAVAALVLQAKGGPGSLTVTQMKSILTGSTLPNDLDPYHSEAVINTAGGTLTITLDADPSASSGAGGPTAPVIDPNVFKVSYSGSGSVASIQLDGTNGNTTGGNEAVGASKGIVFDTRAAAGLPFTLGALSGLQATDITAALGVTAPAPAVTDQSHILNLNFAGGSFTNGRSFGFNIDRDELITSTLPTLAAPTPVARGGNSADLFGANVSIPEGGINPGGVAVTVTMADSSVATGTFVNNIGRGYSPLTGYGFLNAQAAVGLRVPNTVPDGPTAVSAVAGNAKITVAFSPPAANGGSAIFSYTATCGTATQSGTASPIVVTGLTNGTTYMCTVTAQNTTGVSAQSAPSNLATPLAPITFNIVLEGVQQSPRTATPAIGSGTVVVDTIANTLTYNVSYSNLVGTVTIAHFHGPAARGTNAGVKIDITSNPTSGTVTYLETDEADILAGLWYYNLHSSAFGGGEIRGQLDNLGAACGLDIDVDSKAQAGTDGLLVMRYLLGIRGAGLVSGLLASPAALRTDPAKIETVLQRLVDAKRLDIDGNNATDASTDGVLLLRALLGFTGTAVTDNAVGTGTPTRSDWAAIRTYLVDSCKLVLP